MQKEKDFLAKSGKSIAQTPLSQSAYGAHTHHTFGSDQFAPVDKKESSASMWTSSYSTGSTSTSISLSSTSALSDGAPASPT